MRGPSLVIDSMPNVLDSAVNLRAALLAREFSSRDLLEAVLAVISRLNPALNAIVQMDAASAWRAAAESDARISRGEARPLEGLPVTVKDCFETAGMVTAVGAPALKNYLPKEDASAVARLRGAGAIVLGKTNVPLLTGDFQTSNSVYGTTNNPWNLDFSPGGSSGGAAAAIATGMSTLELGSDLAGSIRWPAHCCGVFGLKTTWNVVATYGHIPPTPDMRLERNPELLVAGPLARSAADLSLALDVLAGPRLATIPMQSLLPARKTSPRGLRVALWLDEPLAPVDETVADAVRKAALLLEKHGAIVDAAARPAFSFRGSLGGFRRPRSCADWDRTAGKNPRAAGGPGPRFFEGGSLPSRFASARHAPGHARFYRHPVAAAAAARSMGAIFRKLRRGLVPAGSGGCDPA